MSLLHRGTETVTVFAKDTFTDADCNTRTRPSSVGVVVRTIVQPMTSTQHRPWASRPNRSPGYGWSDTWVSSVPRHRSIGKAIGNAIDGDPRIYNGSRRTAHVDYVIVRR